MKDNQPNNPTIAEMNRDIALFDGYTEIPKNDLAVRRIESFDVVAIRSLAYECDYNELHRAWQRFRYIDRTNMSENERTYHDGHKGMIREALTEAPITESHRLLWEAIKWYNEIKK